MSRSARLRWRPIAFAAAILFAAACNDGSPTAPPGVDGTATITGRVLSTGDVPLGGAALVMDSATYTADSLGQFRIANLAPGSHALRVIRGGFTDIQQTVTLSAGMNTRDFRLTRQEFFDLGDFALHVPWRMTHARGIIVALGGPSTKAFTSAALSFGAPVPAVEADLHELGADLRTMAATHGYVILGTSRTGLVNGAASDQVILGAIRAAAKASVLPELESAPIMLYGISTGAAQASGFATRNAARTAGLFLKVPTDIHGMTSGPALGIPAFVTLAGNDAFVDNTQVMAKVRANRAVGGLWAVALEAGVPHHSLTPAHRALTVSWMGAIMALRTPAGGAVQAVDPAAGWLGDAATGQLAPWVEYAGDRGSANWLPNENLGFDWAALAAAPVATVSGQVVAALTGAPVAGARVWIGTAVDTTDASGRYEIRSLPPKDLTVQVRAAGFDSLVQVLAVPARGTIHNLGLTRISQYETGAFAMYLPAHTPSVRGVILALGGPDGRAFASSKYSFGVTDPALAASLVDLGTRFRTLATAKNYAVVGVSAAALNGGGADALITDALRQFATMSGVPDVATAPLFIYGTGSAGAIASGFAARQPDRVAAVLLRTPNAVEQLSTPEQLGVPTYLLLADGEDNAPLLQAVATNRSRGALWGAIVERGAGSATLSPPLRDHMLSWLAEVATRRLTGGARLAAVAEHSGWLAHPTTGDLHSAPRYAGARAAVGWLPDATTALKWASLSGFTQHSQGLMYLVTSDATIEGTYTSWVAAVVLTGQGTPVLKTHVEFKASDPSVSLIYDSWCDCLDAAYIHAQQPGTVTITARLVSSPPGSGVANGLTASVQVAVVPRSTP